MSLTVNGHMNSVFLTGIKLLRACEEEIMYEWENVTQYLRNTNNKSIHLVEEMIEYFSTILFKHNHQTHEPELEIGSSWKKGTITSLQGAQFVSSLLRNSALKAVQQKQPDFQEHNHALQYVFSVIHEKACVQPYHQHFEIESFLKNLVMSHQLPIEWAAIVLQEKNVFSVEKWFNNEEEDLLLGYNEIIGDSIYSLSESLLRLKPLIEKKNTSVLPIPYEDGTILICTTENSTHILPLISYSLQFFQKGRETFQVTKQENMWKDLVIMFNESIIRSKTLAEAVEQITAGFVKFLPFERCALFSYSKNEQMGFGLHGKHIDNKAIQNITEDIKNLPIIQNYLQLLQHIGKNMSFIQPVYVKDASTAFPERYVKQFQLNSIIIVPIFTSSTSKLIGAAILDQGPDSFFKPPKETFSALLKFGQSAGELLSKYYTDSTEQKTGTKQFSPREIEVLKLMAEGASTQEAASILNLSEYTVRDYVSTIMQKMEAKNRTEAVAKAIREGII